MKFEIHSNKHITEIGKEQLRKNPIFGQFIHVQQGERFNFNEKNKNKKEKHEKKKERFINFIFMHKQQT